MQNGGRPLTDATESGRKETLTERAVGELKQYAVVSAYLWVLFAVFALHSQLLRGEGISVWHQGFAFVNALIFGKVILIGQVLEGRGTRGNGALVWTVFRRSLFFAILLIAFHTTEGAIRAWFRQEALATALADLRGLAGAASYTAIFFIALVPFIAVQELGRVLGDDALWSLFFRPDGRRLRLTKD